MEFDGVQFTGGDDELINRLGVTVLRAVGKYLAMIDGARAVYTTGGTR